jgi:hypothetical protein
MRKASSWDLRAATSFALRGRYLSDAVLNAAHAASLAEFAIEGERILGSLPGLQQLSLVLQQVRHRIQRARDNALCRRWRA